VIDIFLFGGGDDKDDSQNSAFKYDTNADEWSTLAPMPVASSGQSASVHEDLVYIVGVTSNINEFISSNPVSEIWSTLAPTLDNHYCGVTFVLTGCLYAVRGFQPSINSSVERYDVASDTWTAVVNFSTSVQVAPAAVPLRAGPRARLESKISSTHSSPRLPVWRAHDLHTVFVATAVLWIQSCKAR
jgi:hypothetical protein